MGETITELVASRDAIRHQLTIARNLHRSGKLSMAVYQNLESRLLDVIEFYDIVINQFHNRLDELKDLL